MLHHAKIESALTAAQARFDGSTLNRHFSLQSASGPFQPRAIPLTCLALVVVFCGGRAKVPLKESYTNMKGLSIAYCWGLRFGSMLDSRFCLPQRVSEPNRFGLSRQLRSMKRVLPSLSSRAYIREAEI